MIDRRMVSADVAGKGDPLKDTIDRLYGLPLDEFTPARDAAAQERRADKDRDGADTVKRLRKPNLVAWSLNRVRRAQADVVEELIAAGERLQEAQRQLVSGGERGLLRDAAADERRLVGRVADLASAELAAAGHPPDAGTQSKLFATLHAAAANVEVRGLLATGRLVRDHELSDLGLGDGDGSLAAAPVPASRRRQGATTPSATTPSAKTPPDKARAAKPRAAKALAAKQQDRPTPESSTAARAQACKVRTLTDRLERARADHAERVQRVDHARARAHEAERAADEATAALRRAEAEAKRAAATAKKAAAAAEKANASAERAAQSAHEAGETVGALERDLSALTET